ncbi:SgcJ/EcaC family oxidoreductase [Amycolatopsis alba]|uniref:DUF4440 domain-containing protein n=1 Tax=Amycolatopsis alba DSM 44262 TaxID=1125972 RepID=A0A229RZ08_AMYAL|nr:SgcJ/EcaC family oxidoreductase [Amycolatopsis alba]OXM51876.1 DUF4440 domain-containing protein [Amycolatopsis alba DSM 44262]
MTATADTATGVAALPGQIVAAWARHDAEAFADVFVEDGTMILPGVHVKGRDNIAKFMAGAFATAYQGSQVTGTPFDAREIAPGVVVLYTEGGVIQAGDTSVAENAKVRASWTAVLRDGEWKLAAYQNTPRD